MREAMRELLIRYLLGELDAGEQRTLEQRLRESPELRRELEHLQDCFAAARDADDSAEGLPRGLAQRTTERVTGSPCGHGKVRYAGAAALASSEGVDPPVGALGWSLADLTVAGGVFLAVSMLLFPALRDSRDTTRRNVCQNNQRQIGELLFATAEDHAGMLPPIRPHEYAGSFAVQLVEGGRISVDELAVLLFCPDGPLADRLRAGEIAVWIPSAVQLRRMLPAERAEAAKYMSPFFAYQFPYRKGDRYVYLRDERSPHALILSDAPDVDDDMSPNHAGIIQALKGDGSVACYSSYRLPERNDNFFRNAEGMMAAGCERRDIVLGRSEAMPGIEFTAHRP